MTIKTNEPSPLHIKTPLIESLTMGQQVEPKIWLKLESVQPCGSFKARGIGHACQHHVALGATHLLASSAGNAGLAVAYCGRQLDVPVTVVVPVTTKPCAIKLIEQEGANVLIKGNEWDGAHRHAQTLLKPGWAYIHPFDDPLLWRGHATLIDEIAAEGMQPDGIVVSVGGGGLMCGLIEGVRRQGWPDIPLLAVETIGADSLYTAQQKQQPTALDKITSIATSLGARQVANRSFELLSEYPIETHRVSDQQAVAACYQFLRDHRTLVEPACGAALATVYEQADFFAGKKNVVIVVCGGVGVTLDQLHRWQQQLSN